MTTARGRSPTCNCLACSLVTTTRGSGFHNSASTTHQYMATQLAQQPGFAGGGGGSSIPRPPHFDVATAAPSQHHHQPASHSNGHGGFFLNEPTTTAAEAFGALQDRGVSNINHYLNPAVLKINEEGLLVPSRLSRHDKYKTVMCRSWLLTRACPYAERCKYAHGEHELRQIPPLIQILRLSPGDLLKYKTKPCKNFVVDGVCPFGAACRFIHPTADAPIPANATHNSSNAINKNASNAFNEDAAQPDNAAAATTNSSTSTF